MDPNFLWQSLGGGAVITAVLTTVIALARILADYAARTSDRRAEHTDRRDRQNRDAEARLERILQDRLAEADRRLERADGELRAERVRAATLERDLVRLQQALALLRIDYARLAQGGDDDSERPAH
ncbi:MAG: hypothetical protein JO057_05935 [Chloroflexi bacterium]|nr:hypothetical protein [Chloroflexota bacterium]